MFEIVVILYFFDYCDWWGFGGGSWFDDGDDLLFSCVLFIGFVVDLGVY